nr:sulfite exporter TauE/SafE family protein [Actinomycetota bacterium]
STPAIRALGASATIAVGTTLPSILPSAVIGTARYMREDLVDWRIVAWAVPAGVVGSVVGSLSSREVPGDGHILMLLTAALLAFTAARMTRSATAGDEKGPARPAPARTLAAVGFAAGALSGLLGVGGGIVMVPGFHELARVPLRKTIATSLVCVGCLAIPGTITHALLDEIDWRFAALLAVAVVPGARLGAALTMRSSDRRLRLAVASFLGAIALIYAIGELIAL